MTSVEAAKAQFVQAKLGLIKGIEVTAEDRLDWSPSASARTPIEIVAHAAEAVGHMLGNLRGQTYAVPTTAEADVAFRSNERLIKSKEEAISQLEKNSNEYLNWLDNLSESDLGVLLPMPFNLGSVPRSLAISFMPDHLRWHTAQLEYLQTIYGDRDWHID